MQLIKRNNGIIIRDYPSCASIPSDDRKAFERALAQLREFHPRSKPIKWSWGDKVLLHKHPDTVQTAKQRELLLVVAGVGDIKSDGFTDRLDYGYWVFIPRNVTYSLAGMISAMNFRVLTLPLR